MPFRVFKGSDQGANVNGAVFNGLCDLIDAAKTRTMTYHPQEDGKVKRLNKCLMKILSKLISDHRQTGRSWAKSWIYPLPLNFQQGSYSIGCFL